MKITFEFNNQPGLPDFSESYLESISIACNGQDPEDIANKLFDLIGYLSSVSTKEIVREMADLLNSEQQQQLATELLAIIEVFEQRPNVTSPTKLTVGHNGS